MLQQLFTRLNLVFASPSEVSQPVSMEVGNAVQGNMVVFALSGTSPNVTVQLQESNDRENWTDKGAAYPIVSAVGYTLFSATTGISTAYVRFKITAAGTNVRTVLAAGINVVKL